MDRQSGVRTRLGEMTVDELRGVARKLKIRSPERLSKTSLQNLVLEHNVDLVASLLSIPPEELRKELEKSSKLGRRGMVVGIVAGGLITVAASLYFWLNPPPPPQDALRAECVRNMEILREKIIAADQSYKWLIEREREIERAPKWFIPASPYKNFGEQLSKDLPKFKTEQAALLKRGKWTQRDPFKTYSRIYDRLESLEDQERRVTRFLQKIWEGIEDLQDSGAIVTGTIHPARDSLDYLLREYVTHFRVNQIDLNYLGTKEFSELPGDLYFLKEIERCQLQVEEKK